MNSYRGNPLALKIAAIAIADIFVGDLSKFLAQENRVFNGIRYHLNQQFDRLSEREKQVMYWLAIDREPVTAKELQQDLVFPSSDADILETLEY
ncbi:hypothetical protein IQ238_01105 [Pleurocapsales cyanobacterium LEGE 06147]|nr:hypothetical protein [Pleurocapsales cyanobacterium LEGE 06147]